MGGVFEMKSFGLLLIGLSCDDETLPMEQVVFEVGCFGVVNCC